MTKSAFRVAQTTTGAGAAALLLDTAGVPTAQAAYGLRKLRAAYAGSAIRVKRQSDSTEQDIGFSGNALDTAALASFCSGTTGYVAKWYNQAASGSGYDMVQGTLANMWRIYASGAVDVKGSASRPTLFSPDNVRALATSVFTVYQGAILCCACVASMTNTITTLSPRYLNAWGSTNTDNADIKGAILMSRQGSATPVEGWMARHSTGLTVNASGTYDTLQQLASRIDEDANTGDVWVDGVNTTGSANQGTFDLTTMGIGTTPLTPQSVTNGCISEAIVWFAQVDTTARGLIRDNQKAYFGTA